MTQHSVDVWPQGNESSLRVLIEKMVTVKLEGVIPSKGYIRNQEKKLILMILTFFRLDP